MKLFKLLAITIKLFKSFNIFILNYNQGLTQFDLKILILILYFYIIC